MFARKKWNAIIIMLSFLVIAMAAAAAGNDGAGAKAHDAGCVDDLGPSPSSVVAAVSQDGVTFSPSNPLGIAANATIMNVSGGAGYTVSPRFYLGQGIVVFHIDYLADDIEGTFEIALASSDGTTWQLLVDPAGHLGEDSLTSYHGERLIGVSNMGSWTPPGWYEVQVTADGPWSISAERRLTMANEIPYVLTGGTSKAVAVNMPEGPVTFTLSYSNVSSMRGGGYIGVWLYDCQGNLIDSIFVESGTFEGTRTMTFSSQCAPEDVAEDMCPPVPGTYWLEIVGDYGGDWSLRISA